MDETNEQNKLYNVNPNGAEAGKTVDTIENGGNIVVKVTIETNDSQYLEMIGSGKNILIYIFLLSYLIYFFYLVKFYIKENYFHKYQIDG